MNKGWSVDTSGAMADRPDGDIDLDSEKIKEFKVPSCPNCGGVLKPEVTFFGDNVPKSIVHEVLEKMFHSDAVLVLGSSLEVYSGYRFVHRAHGHGMKIAVVNIGPTRADKLIDVKVSAKCGDVLQRLRL
ncbi:NAD-dependent protein deacylase [Elysia marginata]|uniref:NAD-dependent protein deacylase n=1 Tax=Elysia marginata TaxID=1093978 RepID=A0AAV4HBE4_9GAST|nr:NAD-dependent protein deacylase [Elysia marginata]